MYIPQAHNLHSDPDQAREWGHGTDRGLLYRPDPDDPANARPEPTCFTVLQLVAQWTTTLATRVPSTGSSLQKRTTVQDTDTTIGIIVGVVLGVFLVATFAFLYIYRNSLRFTPRKRHHRKSAGSKSSKSSKSSDGGGSAAAPPPT
ncbi:hypothetical protein BJ170DRAFT_369806 [Xylariales sp. AK1849]|nr:hypothetical protein BJ170DRAFT_369806 [Xylariales sp. AK1849]